MRGTMARRYTGYAYRLPDWIIDTTHRVRAPLPTPTHPGAPQKVSVSPGAVRTHLALIKRAPRKLCPLCFNSHLSLSLSLSLTHTHTHTHIHTHSHSHRSPRPSARSRIQTGNQRGISGSTNSWASATASTSTALTLWKIRSLFSFSVSALCQGPGLGSQQCRPWCI